MLFATVSIYCEVKYVPLKQSLEQSRKAVLYDGYLIPFMSLCKIFAGVADGNMYIFNKYTSPK